MRRRLATLVSLFIVSAAIIGYQLSLMRALSVLRYYHFAYLVIGIALLGFGTSGTILALRYTSFVRRMHVMLPGLLVAFAASIPLAYIVATAIPLDVQYLLYSPRQIVLLVAYVLCTLVPFLLGAGVIGLALAEPGADAGVLYGANLAGSGLGGIGTLLLMYVVPPSALPLRLGIVAVGAAVAFLVAAPREGRKSLWHTGALTILTLAAAAASVVIPPPDGVDQYKALSHMRRLEAQDDAKLVALRYGPHGRLDVYDAPSVHRTLFASIQGGVNPPPQLSLLLDGETVSSAFRIEKAADAAIVDFTPQSLAYRTSPDPRVLLLGSTGASAVWLAERFGASAVHVVQSNPQIVDLMRGPLADETGDVFRRPGVTVHTQDPRSFVERSHDPFDVIHLVGSEGMPTASGGLASLHEDYLLTVESFARMLALLSPTGMISVTRGRQAPPRDNVRMLNTAVSALREAGVGNPGNHLFQASNYLAVVTLVAANPLTPDRVSTLVNNAEALQMTVEHAPEPVRVVSESYYAQSARALLAEKRSAFEADWVYRIRPATDERPYFHNFFRWRSLPQFVRAYGGLWITRLELGYVIVVITLAVVSVLAVPLILVPVVALRRSGAGAVHVRITVLHFAAIGLGFFFVEMVFIQRFTRILGNPIVSASAVLTSLLLAAGIGSSVQATLQWRPARRIRVGGIAVILVSLAYLVLFPAFFRLTIDASQFLRYVAVLLASAPPAFFMGWLFPAGLDRVRGFAPRLGALAWGVNGFFSVIATPLAVLLAMEIGFSWVIVVAAAAYVIPVSLSFIRVPAS
jgi:hypothetical protein